MSFRIVCDRDGCAKDSDVGRFGDIPENWIAISGDRKAHNDSSMRLIYCSKRCAVMALGGDWPATMLSAEWLSIPWTPSDELRNSLAVKLSQDLPQVAMGDCYDAVCNLLDVIGGNCTGDCNPETCPTCTDPDAIMRWCDDCRTDALAEAD